MKEETPSVLCVFSLLTAYLSCIFCLSFPVFLPPFSFFLFFLLLPFFPPLFFLGH
jgi:hypothetical protein